MTCAVSLIIRVCVSLSSLELCQDLEKSFVSSREILCMVVEMRSQFGSHLCDLE